MQLLKPVLFAPGPVSEALFKVMFLDEKYVRVSVFDLFGEELLEESGLAS